MSAAAAPEDAAALESRPLYMAGTFSHGEPDPRTWGFGSHPVHEFVVKTASSRIGILRRLQLSVAQPTQPMRPAIWADTPGEPRSGL